MTKTIAINGVDTEAIKTLVSEIEKDPDLAKARFRLHNRWIGGGHNRSTITGFHGAKQEISHLQPFELDCDEPPILAGDDQGANPAEHLLNALGGCMTTTLVYHAALQGIQIDELETELEGDLDMRGFFGLAENVRRGYESIRVRFKVKTDAENLERLKALSRLSPVFDVITNGTNVDLQIEHT